MQSTSKPSTLRHMPDIGSFGDEDNMQFDTIEAELAYHKDKYQQVADMLEETRNELDEFQQSSRELEEELEKELAATEKQQADLKDRIAKLEVEKEEWKNKHIALQKTHSSTTAAMQREMDNLRSERDKTLVALRDLEVGNDELERHGRRVADVQAPQPVAASSLLDMESKLNRAIEDKTLLEQEVIIKGELEDQIQRLKNELRDSADQVSILKDHLSRATLPTPPSSISAPISPSQSSLHLTDSGPVGSPYSSHTGSPLPPPVPPKSSLPPLSASTSSSASGIPSISPASARRFSTQIPSSPGLNRSQSTIRGIPTSSVPSSPGLRRSNTGTFPSPVAARVGAAGIGNGHPSQPQQPGKTKSSRSKLQELRERMKRTDVRLGNVIPKRIPSGASGMTADSRRVSAASGVSAYSSTSAASGVSAASVSAMHSRVSELGQDYRSSSRAGYKTPEAPAGVLSPTGWVLADDASPGEYAEDTPLASRPSALLRTTDPASPLVGMRPTSRATSSTSAKSGSSRMAIPSPLMNMAAQIAALQAARQKDREADGSRPPVSSALSRSNVLAASMQAAAEAGERSQGRARSVLGSYAGSEASAASATRSTVSALSKSTSRAPSRSGVVSPSFDEYTAGHAGSSRTAPPVSGQNLSRSVRAQSRSGTNIPRPSSRMSGAGMPSRPTSPIATGIPSSSGLPRTGPPSTNATGSANPAAGRSPGLSRSTTMNFNSLAEALSAPKGSTRRVAAPDSRPGSSARVASGASSRAGGAVSTSTADVGSGGTSVRARTVSHGRSQSTAGVLGRGAPPVPTVSSTAAAGSGSGMVRNSLTSSQSTRRLAERPTIASSNRFATSSTSTSGAIGTSGTDNLRRSGRGDSHAQAHRTARYPADGQYDTHPEEEEGEDENADADTTLTLSGIPSLNRLNSSTSRTPRSSPGAGLKGRPVSMQHYGTPPEMPAVPAGLKAPRRRAEVPEV